MFEGETYTATEVVRLAGVTYRELDYWVRSGLVGCSVREARGSGTQRAFSADDLALIAAIRRARDAGLSLQAIRRAVALGEVDAFVRDVSDAGANLVAAVS